MLCKNQWVCRSVCLVWAGARRRRIVVIFPDFHSTKQGLPLVDSWSHGLDYRSWYIWSGGWWRCSAKRSPHVWSADNCKINISEATSKPAEKNSSIIEKITSCPFVFLAYHILSFGLEIAKRKRHSLQPCKFLTENSSRWTIDRVYKFFAERGVIEVVMQKNYWRKCQIYRN